MYSSISCGDIFNKNDLTLGALLVTNKIVLLNLEKHCCCCMPKGYQDYALAYIAHVTVVSAMHYGKRLGLYN